MTNGDETPVAVLLAGGAGSRFATGPAASRRGHKLDAVLPATSVEPAETLAERAIRHASAAAIGPVVVVTGGWTIQMESIQQALPNTAREITIVDNPAWAEGQITSLRRGLAAASDLGASRVVVGLADQPFVTPDAWRSVAGAPGPIAVATYGGRRGNPVALDREVWSMLPDSGDEGARALMRIRPDLVREVACSGSPADIDTNEDLHRWQNN